MPRALAAPLFTLLFAAASGAFAQTSVSPQQVQLLAPQLVPFAGSAGNFDSLVNGLTTGVPVTLVTVSTDGTLQIVTFTPGTALTTVDTARLLESARQSLIVRGIAAPTGQQIAASLLGGTVATPSGSAAVTGVLTGTTTSPTPVEVRTGSATPDNPPASGASVALQGVPQGRVRNTSDTASIGTSASPSVNTSTSSSFGTSNTPPQNTVTTAPANAATAAATARTAPDGATRRAGTR